ncbi:MAG: hypothetical protein AVDCRST_MAG08-2736 [uncultured Acetobacteraceae bacterium]|uniref:Uncharacterized protein n=1 Tax=uncultured Acetobacteraceae bacterium TaxID=169975 RepID=A0A6J4IUC1_9PROT|nr:MAG: hypothetical protein AVDCRST_MAG08-2736 [uncultured Acetobacteraceae bacterium]
MRHFRERPEEIKPGPRPSLPRVMNTRRERRSPGSGPGFQLRLRMQHTQYGLHHHPTTAASPLPPLP